MNLFDAVERRADENRGFELLGERNHPDQVRKHARWEIARRSGPMRSGLAAEGRVRFHATSALGLLK
jgi:hypothetical protein